VTRPLGPRRVRIPLAVGLLLLAPVCAEYLTGYDSSTGDPLVLLGGLLFLAPLYGGPALLIREAARRLGIRWPGILALATAFGVVQAGIVDQSMFSDSYRDIEYWDEMLLPTFVAPLGLGAHPALTFVAGHVIWSFGIPIALVESLRPASSRRPWLRVPGLVVVAALYLAAAALVLADHLATESDHASAGQIAGAVVVAALLAAGAVVLGRRRPSPTRSRVPAPPVVGLLALVAALAVQLLPGTWTGVAATVAVLTASALAVGHLARSDRWTGRHVVALVTGALVAGALTGFLAEPLGDVVPAAKYAHNTVVLVGVLLLGGCAAVRNREAPGADART
jgi:hypothetical protein